MSTEQQTREAFDAWCRLREQRDLAEAKAHADNEKLIPNEHHLMALAHGIDMARASLDVPQSVELMRGGFEALIYGAELELREIHRLRGALRALGAHQFAAHEGVPGGLCAQCNAFEADPVHVPGL